MSRLSWVSFLSSDSSSWQGWRRLLPLTNTKRREFNVGIEAAQESALFEWRVKPKTLDGIMRVKGALVVTVYAPVRISLKPETRRRSSPVRGK